MEEKTQVIELLTAALGKTVGRLLADDSISEVRLNSDGSVWAYQLGQGKSRIDCSLSPENVRRAIYAVAYSVNEVCNEEHPHISAELPGSGQRFQGILPPVVKGPVAVIRKKAVRIFTLEELEQQGVLMPGGGEILREKLRGRENILIVGGTDSGKTTFANALLQVISDSDERIVILEDTQELQCRARDVEYLRTRDGVCSLRDLVRVTLRLSPDRIVIGEVRGAEALDLLKAWNTGHGGGVCTVHASSAKQGLSRLEQLVQEAGVSASRAMIAEAVNVIVYMEKVGTKRLVREISEVRGFTESRYELQGLSYVC